MNDFELETQNLVDRIEQLKNQPDQKITYDLTAAVKKLYEDCINYKDRWWDEKDIERKLIILEQTVQPFNQLIDQKSCLKVQ